MMTITTISGASYSLYNGRITRSAQPNPYLPPEYNPQLSNHLVAEVLEPAVVGKRFKFRTARGMVVTTSTVVDITRH